MQNGQIYYIDFTGSKGSEINAIHLGIIFSFPKVTNMFFCIPFKTFKGFKERNYLALKYQNYIT